MGVNFSKITENHKVIYECNNKKDKLQAPEWIILAERHRGDYDSTHDRQLNDKIITALNDVARVILIEYPQNMKVDQKTHPQTEKWPVEENVYGCFNPSAFKKIKDLHGFFWKVMELYSSFQGVDETEAKLKKLIQNEWQHDWPEDNFSIPIKQKDKEKYRNALIQFAGQLQDYAHPIINSSHEVHMNSIIETIETHKNQPRLFVLVGKNHLSLPKKLQKYFDENRQNNITDPLERSISLLHNYLQASGKWCVILKPIKRA